MITFHFKYPQGFLYWLTVFELPDVRISCIARNPDGEILFSNGGRMYPSRLRS